MKNNILFWTFTVTAFLSSSAFAEYYGPSSNCEPSFEYETYHHKPRVKKSCHCKHKRVSHHRRHYYHVPMQRNSYSVTEYTYYAVPGCGCRYVPGHCKCGQWVPSHYQRDYVTFRAGPVRSFGATYYTPNYSRDRATADDYLPDMQIN